MILTPIASAQLAATLDRFAAPLPCGSLAARAFRRIADSRARGTPDPVAWLRAAVGLAEQFGMAPVAESPAAGFSWDGTHVRTLSEPSFVVHEVAHFQLASPARRGLPDFGLGAGPETGRVAEADDARRLDDAAREAEEQMASLLGVLWEIELGQPGILAFQEQNWLEGAGRPSAATCFAETLERIAALGLLDRAARPVAALRIAPDR